MIDKQFVLRITDKLGDAERAGRQGLISGDKEQGGIKLSSGVSIGPVGQN